MPVRRNAAHPTSRFIDAPFVLIGPGRWGTALTSALPARLRDGQKFSVLDAHDDWDQVFIKQNLSRPTLVLLAVPFKAINEVLEKLKPYRLLGVINASKGIDRASLKTFSALATKILGRRIPSGSLSGPTFAKELMEQRPSAAVIASSSKVFARETARLFSNSYFRLYESADPVGVEVCGAVKNVLAIACGLCDGLGLGHNARAALLTRGLVEMKLLVKTLGGRTDTANGLAGVGDLWLTATGDLSRNRMLGVHLAQNPSLEVAVARAEGPVEGLYTVGQVYDLAKKRKLDLPICKQIYAICHQGRNPREAVQKLMGRALRSEF